MSLPLYNGDSSQEVVDSPLEGRIITDLNQIPNVAHYAILMYSIECPFPATTSQFQYLAYTKRKPWEEAIKGLYRSNTPFRAMSVSPAVATLKVEV